MKRVSLIRAAGCVLGLALTNGCIKPNSVLDHGSDTDVTDTDTDVVPGDLVDSDEDGYGSVASGGNDCDDGDADVHPGATEVCNGTDDDCDGHVDEGLSCEGDNDADDDGYDSTESGGDDCDDGDFDVNPGATEVCNGVDDDCDGETDEGLSDCSASDDNDDDGYTVGEGDCDDDDADVNPGQIETSDEECSDGIDNDCDGDVDGDDLGCQDVPDDLGESLDWIKVDGNKLGLSYSYVFTTSVVDSDEIALTGDGVQEDWAYDEDNLCDYDGDTDFEWSQELEDGLYRVNMRGTGDSDSYWGDFQSFCQASEGDPDFQAGFGPSSLCHENSDGSWSICFIVDSSEIGVADPEDCDSLE